MSENDTPKENSNKENRTDHKLPYIGDISVRTKKKIGKLCKIQINIVWTPFKIGSLFSSKDRLCNALRSIVVYKFTCAGCQSWYIGEKRRHLASRIKEHLVTNKMSHIMKHLLENKICRSLCDESCFQVIDYASFPFRLKVKEALNINWLKSSLNKQKEHVNITISVLLGHFVSSLSSSSSLLIVFIWLIHCTWVFVQIQHSHNTHTRTCNIKITILFNSGHLWQYWHALLIISFV